eukprot:364639-Chlamydomonas_euryale.AAC.56
MRGAGCRLARKRVRGVSLRYGGRASSGKREFPVGALPAGAERPRQPPAPDIAQRTTLAVASKAQGGSRGLGTPLNLRDDCSDTRGISFPSCEASSAIRCCQGHRPLLLPRARARGDRPILPRDGQATVTRRCRGMAA